MEKQHTLAMVREKRTRENQTKLSSSSCCVCRLSAENVQKGSISKSNNRQSTHWHKWSRLYTPWCYVLTHRCSQRYPCDKWEQMRRKLEIPNHITQSCSLLPNALLFHGLRFEEPGILVEHTGYHSFETEWKRYDRTMNTSRRAFSAKSQFG